MRTELFMYIMEGGNRPKLQSQIKHTNKKWNESFSNKTILTSHKRIDIQVRHSLMSNTFVKKRTFK